LRPHSHRRSEVCIHHTKLLATVDGETMRQGRTPKKPGLKESGLRVVSESSEVHMKPSVASGGSCVPA
jgi:hypothetical protein